MTLTAEPRTTTSHPRPQMVRERWLSLDGPWDLAFDDDRRGLPARWFDPSRAAVFDERVEVPVPPEAPASGLGRPGPHPVLWYRRTVGDAELARAGVSDGSRVLLHLGAVDHAAVVWVDGQRVADHVGGSTPFTADVTEALDPTTTEHVVVVRAEDDPTDPDQARGKQDWRTPSHGIWYGRTTGIWQSVWVEAVPVVHVAETAWTPDVPGCALRGRVSLSGPPPSDATVEVTLRLDGEVLARQDTLVRSRTVDLDVRIDALRNAQDRERLLGSPERPTLVDVDVRLLDAVGSVIDEVAGYTGLRSVGVDARGLLLNGLPYYLRSVLDQGFRPDTHLAADDARLRTEVETIKALGFNAVRVHQKSEDPRFLAWADRLGLLVWAEAAAHYAFSADAASAFTTEWLDLVRRDRSHPSVCLWVPINESWGVPEAATDPAQQSYAAGLAALTRALDPSRPVVSNEGWEHVDSDVVGVHDYTTDPDALRRSFGTPAAVDAVVLDGRTAHGRRTVVTAAQARRYRDGEVPVMLTEFGGVSLTADADTWGYTTVGSAEEYGELLSALFDAVRASPVLSGFCYTQLLDTGQETNGLLFADGTPKLPVETIRRIVTGTSY